MMTPDSASTAAAAEAREGAGETTAGRTADTTSGGAGAGSTASNSPEAIDDLVGVCAVDRVDSERLDVTATWQGRHVHVAGRVRDGAGNTLILTLSRKSRFVSDEVFKGERLGAIELVSDSLDVTSVSYAPTPAEQAAFARRRAILLDPSVEICLDASLYHKLKRLASRHIVLPPAP
jgi:hypothetical protein